METKRERRMMGVARKRSHSARTVWQSLLFSGAFILLYYGVQMGWGYILSHNDVPDITTSYQSVAYLQQEVTFGYIARPSEAIKEILILWGIGTVLFVAGKFVFKKMKRNASH